MSKSVQLIKDHDVKWIDLRFTDTKGTQHHVTMPARDALDDDFFEVGKMFDGSSIAGWKDRKSTRLNSSHLTQSRMPSSA